MTKNELIQYLRAFLQAENRCYEIESEVTRLKNTIANLKKEPTLEERQGLRESFGPFLSSTIMGSVVLGVLYIIALLIATTVDKNGTSLFVRSVKASVAFFHFNNHHPIFFFILPPLFVSAIISLLLEISKAINHNKTYPQRNQKKIEEHKKNCAQLPALEASLNKKMSELRSASNYLTMLKQQNVIHPDYLYYASWLLGYLEKGRADSLKEALNLLEQERTQIRREMARENHEVEMEEHARAQTQALNRIADETSRNADASERAAQRADDAAFWGAVSAFEIDKMRRDSKK